MYELTLGFIPDEEMADWCGKTMHAYKKNRKRWAENTLINFATFEIIKGGINILSIKEPIYSRSARQEVKKKWKSYWGYNGNNLDSNKECWNKMKPAITSPLPSDKTGASYVSYWKCEDYGSARTGHKREGRLGSCKYTFCIILKGIPTKFDEQDYKIKFDLEEKYLNVSYKEQKYEMQALYSEYKRGEITKEEYEESLKYVVETDLGWKQFQEKLEKALQEKYNTQDLYVDFRQEIIGNGIKIFAEKQKEFDF